jgi:hypothetical protein
MWPIVKRFTNNDLMGLGAKVPGGTCGVQTGKSGHRKVPFGPIWDHQRLARFDSVVMGRGVAGIESTHSCHTPWMP